MILTMPDFRTLEKRRTRRRPMTTRAKATPAIPPFPTVTEASHDLAGPLGPLESAPALKGGARRILSAKWLETITRPSVALPGGTKSTPPDKTLSAAPGRRAADPDCRVARHRGPNRARPTAPAKTKITTSHACTQSGWLPGCPGGSRSLNSAAAKAARTHVARRGRLLADPSREQNRTSCAWISIHAKQSPAY